MKLRDERITQQEAAIAELKSRNEHLAQENEWLRGQLFGRSSEKRPVPVPEDQPHLFNEAEAVAAAAPEEERVVIDAHSRAKRGRKPIPDTLRSCTTWPRMRKSAPRTGRR